MVHEYHDPVLLQACLEGLNIDPDGVYVDVTFGGGGHDLDRGVEGSSEPMEEQGIHASPW